MYSTPSCLQLTFHLVFVKFLLLVIYYLYLCIGIWQCHTHSLPVTVFPCLLTLPPCVAYHALPFAMLCAVCHMWHVEGYEHD